MERIPKLHVALTIATLARERGQEGIALLALADHTCPCCKGVTLELGRGQYEICWRCGWEDDGQDDYNADLDLGGPNEGSLTDARKRWRFLSKLFLPAGISSHPPGE